MTQPEPVTFERPWLLLCEGRGDERFFKKLIQVHALGDDFQIQVPILNGEYCGGRNCFGRYLRSIETNEGFLSRVRCLLVVSDNDKEASFSDVQTELRKAALAVPDGPGVIARSKGKPPVAVLMLPMQGTGNLEKLCLVSAYTKWHALKDHLDTFVANSPASSWEEGLQSKMRMQTILAATNDHQPECGFAGSWRQKEQYQVPVDHECFTTLVNFLKSFPDLVAAWEARGG